jgi:hypothetical protein
VISDPPSHKATAWQASEKMHEFEISRLSSSLPLERHTCSGSEGTVRCYEERMKVKRR